MLQSHQISPTKRSGVLLHSFSSLEVMEMDCILGDSMTESLLQVVHTRPLQSLLDPAFFRIYDYFKCLFAEDIPCHCEVIFCPLIKVYPPKRGILHWL